MKANTAHSLIIASSVFLLLALPFTIAAENAPKLNVISCTSQQIPQNAANYAVDGDPKTIWHTAFRPNTTKHPHEIVIDLGQQQTVTGFYYLPRTDDGANGVIKDFQCYVTDHLSAQAKPTAKGRFFDSSQTQYTERRIAFDKKITARYLKLVSLSSVNGEPFTSAAEIGIFTGKMSPTKLPAIDRSKVICFAMYTTQNNILKLTAQLYPEILQTDETVALEVKQTGKWKQVDKTTPILPGWSAIFRVENWDMTKDIAYRVVAGKDTYEGLIKHDPIEKDKIVAAVFTGNSSYPWGGGKISKQDIVDNINKVDPDVLLFTGDQVYVHSNHTKHWIQFGETFGDMIKIRPTVCIPDDHDVGQPNIWGAGGRKTDRDSKGGYTKPIEYVNMVHRQQTSHLPDPYDPTPIEQGMAVYYTTLNIGGIDMAIIEDRKFKSGPYQFDTVGKKLASRPDFIEVSDYDPADYDLPHLKLLGDRQLKFLKDWSNNWDGSVIKVVVSQTVFSQTSTNHGPKDSFYYVDFDSNAWPQTGRNKAIRLMRKCFAFNMCGDQHLSTIGQYGIDDFRDSGWWFCVPSISNTYPRRWAPKRAAVKTINDGMDYTGDYFDSLGNKMTIYAHTNPRKVEREPVELHERMPGFGLVHFDKPTRNITMECWPRMTDPTDPASKQYQGWPRTINQLDNYARTPAAWLPEIIVAGIKNAVIEIINERTNQTVYSIRIKGNTFTPKVFETGKYTVSVGQPETDQLQKRQGIRASKNAKTGSIKFVFKN